MILNYEIEKKGSNPTEVLPQIFDTYFLSLILMLSSLELY